MNQEGLKQWFHAKEFVVDVIVGGGEIRFWLCGQFGQNGRPSRCVWFGLLGRHFFNCIVSWIMI